MGTSILSLGDWAVLGAALSSGVDGEVQPAVSSPSEDGEDAEVALELRGPERSRSDAAGTFDLRGIENLSRFS